MKSQQTVIDVWPGAAPGTENWSQKESSLQIPGIKHSIVRNVTKPTLTAFLPDRGKAKGTGVIVVPGGGFRVIDWDGEGVASALRLAEQGIAAFLLKYRVEATPGTDEELLQGPLLPPPLPVGQRAPNVDLGPNCGGPNFQGVGAVARPHACADVRQAMKVLREKAGELGLRADRIGLLAFSAGTFASTELAIRNDASNRPSFVGLVYGGGTTEGRPVPKEAPPLFLAHAQNDSMLSSAKSLDLYSAWTQANLPVELHIYATGGHGFGGVRRGYATDHVIDAYTAWLVDLGFLDASSRS